SFSVVPTEAHKYSRYGKQFLHRIDAKSVLDSPLPSMLGDIRFPIDTGGVGIDRFAIASHIGVGYICEEPQRSPPVRVSKVFVLELHVFRVRLSHVKFEINTVGHFWH